MPKRIKPVDKQTKPYEICVCCDNNDYPLSRVTGTCLRCRDEEIAKGEEELLANAPIGSQEMLDAAKWLRNMYKAIEKYGEPEPTERE